MIDSDEDSSGDSFSDDTDEGDLDEDRCNSAGEEMEEDEFDESQVCAVAIVKLLFSGHLIVSPV